MKRPNNGKSTQKGSQRTNKQKKEKHRLRLLRLAAQADAATAAATSSAGDEDDVDDDDDDEEYDDGDSDADDASEQDTGKSPPAQSTASGTKPASIPKRNALPASQKNPSPSRGGGASSGRPANPFALRGPRSRRTGAPSQHPGPVGLSRRRLS